MLNLQATSLKHPFLEGLFWLCVILCILLTMTGYGWLGIAGFIVLIWSRLVTPILSSLRGYTFTWPKLQSKKTILFVSDFHAGGEKGERFYQRTVHAINAYEPDVVLLGGDFVEEYASSIKQLACLKDIKAKHGVYFVRGNHDYLDRPDLIKKQLEEWGLICLENRLIDLGDFELAGLQDSWFGLPDTSILSPKTKPRVLLIHEPDGLLDIEKDMADLILIGHTHGGQVRLPFIGPVITLPQNISQTYDRGQKDWKGIPVIITQGIGESTAPLRLFCWPQIVMIELVLS